MQALQMIETKTARIDGNQLDLLEKKLIQSNASFINQSEMNLLLNDGNLKSGTVLFITLLDLAVQNLDIYVRWTLISKDLNRSRGHISLKEFCAILIRKFKLIEPIFEHYKLFALMPDGERLIITEQDEFTRIYEGIGLQTEFLSLGWFQDDERTCKLQL